MPVINNANWKSRYSFDLFYSLFYSLMDFRITDIASPRCRPFDFSLLLYPPFQPAGEMDAAEETRLLHSFA